MSASAKMTWIDRFSSWLAGGVATVLSRFFVRADIGRAGDVYLTRWDLLNNRFGPGWKLFVHRFLRSDEDSALHDHPWPFWSLILAGGYFEWTPTPPDEVPACGPRVARWYGPGSLLRRPAVWRHRVELPAGRECWTLLLVGEKERSWGFHCPGGFVPWREFVARTDRKEAGCGEVLS